MKRIDRAKLAFIRESLMEWYALARRDLPWRRGRRDPYAVWVAEIMLQQTQVATAGPYFERFLKRFPVVAALARARLSSVLKAWEGMGYYSRARNLHAAARIVAGKLGGELPRTAEGLRALPGIGAYTAGAIASIAFGCDEPVVDGNVARVLARVFAVEGDPKSAAGSAALWSLARRLVPPGRAGEFNEALMDLGATVCTPRRPNCPRCPLARRCTARRTGRQEELPRKPPRRLVPHVLVVAGVVWKDGRVLIDRRPAKGLLGGLWEFPGGKIEPGEIPPEALARELAEEVGIRVRIVRQMATVRHAYSHFRITMTVFECRWIAGRARPIACDAVNWIRPHDLRHYAFPAANAKVIALLQNR